MCLISTSAFFTPLFSLDAFSANELTTAVHSNLKGGGGRGGAKSHSEELGLSEGCTKWRLTGRYFKRSRIAGKHGHKHDMMKKLKPQEGNSIEGKIHYFTKVRYLFA